MFFAAPFVLFLMILWAFVGLFFWLPGVVRAGIVLIAGTLGNAVLQEENATSLDDFGRAVMMYPNGFVLFAKTLTNPPEVDPERVALKALPKEERKIKESKLNQERLDELSDKVGKFFVRFFLDGFTWLAMIAVLYMAFGILGKPLPGFLPKIIEIHTKAQPVEM